MARKRMIIAAASVVASTAGAAIPPAYRDDLPPRQREGDITYITGGVGQDEAQAIKRAAQDFPLELVFVERNGRKQEYLAAMPVRIVNDKGKVVFEGVSDGPYFIAKLPKGKYTVSTRWDAWSFSRPVTIGKARQRVVFAWGAPGAAPVA